MNRSSTMSAEERLTIAVAANAADVRAVARLFEAYRASLSVDLCFQGFDAELASLPGAYGVPGGGLWLARLGDQAVGCCALRPAAVEDSQPVAELKRLYVAPSARGHGAGRRLLAVAIGAARTHGYAAIVLDTLPQMQAARTLYTEAGFERIAPYYDTPLTGTEFMRLVL